MRVKRIIRVKWENVILLLMCVLAVCLLFHDGITLITSMFSYTKSFTSYGIITDLIAMFTVASTESVLKGE